MTAGRLLTTVEAALYASVGRAVVTPATVRSWAHRGVLPVADRDGRDRPLYDPDAVLDAEWQTRRCDPAKRRSNAAA